MKLNGFTKLAGVAGLMAVATCDAAALSKNNQPNIVIILADDLGVECLSSYGGTSHHTPNIDRLATQGMQFTYCFSNPLCSPSRASLLTGRYPFKNGLKEVLWNQNQADVYLHPDQPSFVRQLKEAGYATGLAGKWHMSLLNKHNTIREFGFDEYQVWQIFDTQGNKRRRYWTPHINRNGTLITDQIKDRYGPDLDMEFLRDFITSNAKKKQPFLAYFATCLPHYPWEPTPDSKEQGYRAPTSEAKGDPKYFPDMVAYLDKLIGQLMHTLDEQGIADNTVVLFLADNGTDRDLRNLWGDGKSLHGGKGTMTDRGTHVPLIIRWPGQVKPGSTCNDLVDFSDLFPTICEMTGAPLPKAAIHGKSFLPQLVEKPHTSRQWVHIQNKEDRQVRSTDYMLNNQNELRPVVELWEEHPKPNQNKYPEKEAAARKYLQSVFDELGN